MQRSWKAGLEPALVAKSGPVKLVKLDQCTWSFNLTLKMPCHHIFAVRLSLNMPIFREEMIAQRWLRSYQSAGILDQNTSKVSDDDDADQLISPESRMHMSSLDTETKAVGNTGSQPKVRKMQSLCQRLAVIASECGMPQYRERFAQVNKLIDLWERNVPALVCAVGDYEVSAVNMCVRIYKCTGAYMYTSCIIDMHACSKPCHLHIHVHLNILTLLLL